MADVRAAGDACCRKERVRDYALMEYMATHMPGLY